MLKLGIEPKTFALLARRSNQLSYSSTELSFHPSYIIDSIMKKQFSKWVRANRKGITDITIQDIHIIQGIRITRTVIQEEVGVGVEVEVKVLCNMTLDYQTL